MIRRTEPCPLAIAARCAGLVRTVVRAVVFRLLRPKPRERRGALTAACPVYCQVRRTVSRTRIACVRPKYAIWDGDSASASEGAWTLRGYLAGSAARMSGEVVAKSAASSTSIGGFGHVHPGLALHTGVAAYAFLMHCLCLMSVTTVANMKSRSRGIANSVSCIHGQVTFGSHEGRRQVATRELAQQTLSTRDCSAAANCRR
jgi:hypothetical protein